ncbi:MAG TPA: ATP-binding cassette domain-containing protein, partial [Candidatus Caccosoma faecigallinarum]|nr:ATP-binding cassette domain-containing protein [Candidatus Caccosoma faecigallinarum]
KSDATYEEIIEVAKIARAHDFIIKKPFGYDTKLGNKGAGLSGGEKQRIAIARAILNRPKIFILDEATSSLDTITEKEIQDALNEIVKRKTTFVIAHRLSTLKNADRLIVLNKGEMVEFGTHQELMKKKGYYYELVNAQKLTYQSNNEQATLQD